MTWPGNPFWDYALELYRRPGVEGACLELQERHGLDVNVVLLCCWLGSRGAAADEATLRRIAEAAEGWRAGFIEPLRAVRGRLKAELADPRPGSIPARWSELTTTLRQRALALEIDGERLEQLLLAELAADLAVTVAPGIAVASANLQQYWRFAASDRAPLATVLKAAFPEAQAGAVATAIDRLAR